MRRVSRSPDFGALSPLFAASCRMKVTRCGASHLFGRDVNKMQPTRGWWDWGSPTWRETSLRPFVTSQVAALCSGEPHVKVYWVLLLWRSLMALASLS